MLDYAALAAIAAVVREGSFERAATALGVTASAVSQRVRALEERLGSVLIVRSQPCTATPLGARLCAHLEQVRLLEGEMVTTLPALAGAAGSDGPPTLRIAVNRDSLGAWFVPALARFAEASGALVDLVLEREEYTPDRLRSGEVLAAVTDSAAPVQGCRMIPLGGLRYVATAAPAFVRRWFPHGVDGAALARAPVLVFDRGDHLQAQWARQITGRDLRAPIHWVPDTRGFLDACRTGLGWGLNPVALIRDGLAGGELVELAPGCAIDVPLHWQHARIGSRLLDALTGQVLAAAKQGLIQP